MKRSIVIAVLVALSLNQTLWACSSIVAGKKTTVNGAVFFGHNEDDYGQRVVNACCGRLPCTCSAPLGWPVVPLV